MTGRFDPGTPQSCQVQPGHRQFGPGRVHDQLGRPAAGDLPGRQQPRDRRGDQPFRQHPQGEHGQWIGPLRIVESEQDRAFPRTVLQQHGQPLGQPQRLLV
jgi:hypothetical protein